MDTMIREYLATILRNLAAPLIAFLAASGYFSESEATNLVVAVIAAIVALAWGIINKHLWKKTAVEALNTPPPATEKKLEDVISQK
jgi:uncharacterized membrane protein